MYDKTKAAVTKRIKKKKTGQDPVDIFNCFFAGVFGTEGNEL